MLAQALANQSNKEIFIPLQVPAPTTLVRDYMRMSPPTFHGSNLEEDPIDFIDKAYRIVTVMGVPLKEKA